MEKLKELFSRTSGQFKDFWGKLSTAKKAIFLGVIGIVAVGLGALFSMKEADPYEYVFENLSSDDTQAIVDYFRRNGIENYQTDAKGVKVPVKDKLKMRLKLSQEGLPTHGAVGWEKFDSQEFTRTEFEQKIHRLRAVQGELQRTIMMFDQIATARVHIVMPRQSLFVEDQKEPTAAVYLKVKRGKELGKKEVQGIIHLVSMSVEGLKPKNVSVIDHESRMLNEPEPDTFASKITKERMAYKRSKERYLEQKVRELVGRIVGPDRVEAKVDVEVDFTEERQTISDLDPDRAVPIAKTTTGYRLQGQGLNPTGIPGQKSNVPGEQENLTVNTSSTENKKDSEAINFEVAKTISQKTLPIGDVKRVTVAVLVDGKQDYPIDGTKPVFEPRTEDEMKQIENIVKFAIGYDDKRGDAITVQNMMFQLDQFQIETIKEEKAETREYMATLAISGAISLALVLFFAFVVRPYFRWLSYDPDRKKEQQVVEEFKPDLELGALQNVQVKEDVPFEKLTPQEQVLYLAKNEPKRTTEAIRLLLNPHQTVG